MCYIIFLDDYMIHIFLQFEIGEYLAIPAGAKPVSLNLFFEETRSIVKIELK